MVLSVSTWRALHVAGLLMSTATSTMAETVGATIAGANPRGTQLSVGLPDRKVTRVERANVVGERFAAKNNETFEILFADGSSITLSPEAAIVVDQFDFNDADGSGAMAVRLEKGSMRIMGGLLNQKAAVRVTAGNTRSILTNGGAFFSLAGQDVRMALLVAGSLEVSNDQGVQTLKRPGYETVVAAGSAPTAPTQQVRGQAFVDAAIINPGLRTGSVGHLSSGVDLADNAGDVLDDPNILRVDVERIDQNLTYAVNLPGGLVLAAGSAATGAIVSLGGAVTGDGAPDILLTQDYEAGPFLLAQRNVGFTANRTSNPSLDYALGPETSPGQLSANAVDLHGTVPLSYLVSSTLLSEQELFGSGGYARVPDQSVDINVGSIDPTALPAQVTVFPGLPGETKLFLDLASVRSEDGGTGRLYADYFNADRSSSVTLANSFSGTAFYTFAGGFKRDTVFALTQPYFQQQVVQIDGPIPLAVPHSYVFAEPGKLSVNTLDRTVSLYGVNQYESFLGRSFLEVSPDAPTSLADFDNLISKVTGRAPTLSDDPSNFSGFDHDGNISLNVAGFSAGFANAATWDQVQSGVIDASFPRSRDNFVSVMVTDDYNHSVFFAAGDVSSSRTPADGASIDTFVISRGLNPADFQSDAASDPSVYEVRLPTAIQDFRSFLPSTSGVFLSSSQASTPLLIVNPIPGADGALTSRAFHSDLAVSLDGQESSVSVTLGQLHYTSNAFGNFANFADDTIIPDTRSLVTFSGSTVGSTQRKNAAGVIVSPSLLYDSLTASAAGGGNDWNGSPRPGYAGYLVLENVSDAAIAIAGVPGAQRTAALAVLNSPALSRLTPEDLTLIFSRGFASVAEYSAYVAVLTADEFSNEIANLRFNRVGSNLVSTLDQQAFLAVLDTLSSPALTTLSQQQQITLKSLQLASLSPQEIDALGQGGKVRPLVASAGSGGADAPSNFGLLRLAAGTSSVAVSQTLDRAAGGATTARLDGFVAGLHQVANGLSDGLYLGSIGIAVDGVDNSVRAGVSYNRPIAAALPDGQSILGFEKAGTILLGDVAPAGGQSAYIRPGQFGASATTSDGATAAIIAGESVKAGLGVEQAAKIATYEHVQWGFFFGDLLPQNGARTHTALSTWAAGRRAESGESIQGTASYRGHAIGTVVRQGADAAIYTSVGTFEQQWNLSARTASMTLDFDHSVYQGGLAGTTGPGIAYSGVLNRHGGKLQAGIGGELVAVQSQRPQGSIGQFQIRGLDASYQANGAFAGDVRP